MTPEEKEQLEKDYPQFNWPRLGMALIVCGAIMLVAAVFL